MMKSYSLWTLAVFTVFVGLAGGVSKAHAQGSENVPIYRVTVVNRTIPAINYEHRSGSTKVDFRGTSLMPDAQGTAEVQSRQGAIHVNVDFKHLQPASKFGPEYLTYVLWAISPEGRPLNIGEVLLNDDGNSKLQVTSNLQSFGMIVTAEPYFSVTRPSDVVVMENFVTGDTNGTIEQVNAKYDLLKRGQYSLNVSPSELQSWSIDTKVPLELYEARNAVRIAEWSGAARYAGDSLQKAKNDLANANDLEMSRHGDRKELITLAREAAQTAEDAREIAVRKQLAEYQAQQQQNAAAAETQAQSQAQQAQAEAQQANQEKAQAQSDAAAALAQQKQAEAETQNAQQQAEAAKQQAEQAQQQTQQAQQQAQQAENDKQALRAKLLQQLNAILQTRDTAVGLVVNMSDILFETAQYKLKAGAREALAKISGVLLAYPGLSVTVNGYTDNVGSEQTNETLSDKRAESVRDFLVQQGVPANSITAQGYGEGSPVAVNDTAIGRQLNRRVELVLSGDLIGAAVGGSPSP